MIELQLDDCAVSSVELCTLCPLVESAASGDGVLRVLRLEGNLLLRTDADASRINVGGAASSSAQTNVITCDQTGEASSAKTAANQRLNALEIALR